MAQTQIKKSEKELYDAREYWWGQKRRGPPGSIILNEAKRDLRNSPELLTFIGGNRHESEKNIYLNFCFSSFPNLLYRIIQGRVGKTNNIEDG